MSQVMCDQRLAYELVCNKFISIKFGGVLQVMAKQEFDPNRGRCGPKLSKYGKKLRSTYMLTKKARETLAMLSEWEGLSQSNWLEKHIHYSRQTYEKRKTRLKTAAQRVEKIRERYPELKQSPQCEPLFRESDLSPARLERMRIAALSLQEEA
jgi:hypothetical protein